MTGENKLTKDQRYQKEWYLKNRDKKLAQSKNYFKLNKVKILAYQKAYYKSNRKKIIARCKKYNHRIGRTLIKDENGLIIW
jgi:hypothetical protein